MSIKDFQMLKIVKHPHLIVRLMRSWVIEEIEMFQRSQYLNVFDDVIEISEFVVVEDQGFDVFEDVEDSIDGFDLVILKEEMLESEVLLQSFEIGKVVVVEP